MQIPSIESLEPRKLLAAQIQVTGNNLVIENNDVTPSVKDGTSFGEVSDGEDAPTLTFTLTNTGDDTLNIDGARPDVSGDFVLIEGLPASVAAGASDDFTVRLSTNTAGVKTGAVTITQPNTNAGGFTFNIAGTVSAPAPGPNFAVLSGSTLTVTGTETDDNVSMQIAGKAFTVTRNSLTSDAFVLSTVTKIVVNLLGGNDSYSSPTQMDIRQTINGGAGNDLLRGGKQVDVLNGGDGDDRMDGRSRGDTFNGEGGSDVALYRQRRANESVTVIIDELANDGGIADLNRDNVLSSTEHVYGGLGDDNLTGSSKTNRLFGFEGNDTLNGLKGNDTLSGGAGANNLDGGFGNDTLFSRNAIGDVIEGGADTDSLMGDLLDTVSNVENPDLE